ncbi:hypothetical protein [Sinorhizobium arboris]|uniref:hypothetical protein n=1 Tax=Sinorhizobium arboris TaxID=76745 RepID=UPI000481F8FF|nr:hypothetical protein [Sinorhizobium arboris]
MIGIVQRCRAVLRLWVQDQAAGLGSRVDPEDMDLRSEADDGDERMLAVGACADALLPAECDLTEICHGTFLHWHPTDRQLSPPQWNAFKTRASWLLELKRKFVTYCQTFSQGQKGLVNKPVSLARQRCRSDCLKPYTLLSRRLPS